MRPIVAYHVVFSTYGFWLPNDPRGSWSKRVWAPLLVRFGPPVAVTTSRSRARAPHDHARRQAAKLELQLPALRFTGVQARAVGRGIAVVAESYGLPIYAAAVMPDHVHLVIARQAQRAEDWVGYFKRAASRKLREEKLHPFQDRPRVGGTLPTAWGAGGWKVYLHDDAEIIRNIQYVEQNPIVAGLPAQSWAFVTPYPRTPRGRGG